MSFNFMCVYVVFLQEFHIRTSLGKFEHDVGSAVDSNVPTAACDSVQSLQLSNAGKMVSLSSVSLINDIIGETLRSE